MVSFVNSFVKSDFFHLPTANTPIHRYNLRHCHCGTIEMNRLVTNWPCLPPPKCRIFPLISVATNRAAVLSPADSPNIKRPPTVDCGMVEFLDRDRSVLPSRFGQGIKPPRRPNFAQNMHPNKRCRRSLARPNRTTPEYHDVDHGVAVGWQGDFWLLHP
jgi:hypothetical protein